MIVQLVGGVLAGVIFFFMKFGETEKEAISFNGLIECWLISIHRRSIELDTCDVRSLQSQPR